MSLAAVALVSMSYYALKDHRFEKKIIYHRQFLAKTTKPDYKKRTVLTQF